MSIKPLKVILNLFILLLTPILLYFITAHLLTLFPSPKEKGNPETEVYILYDEMHSDIVIKIDKLNPKLKNYLKDVIQNRRGYLAFGWGDRETYLNTPTWNDMELSTALKALFINTPSLLHVHFYREVKRFRYLKKIRLSKKAEEQLERAIFKSFDSNKGKIKGYGKNDFFYPSIYSYNLFHTCNTWTGDRLRDANISTAYWTPLSYNIIDSLP